ncbi:NBR1-Ig-like domain-containing protein [Methanocella sp. MCL-LM]|uniref:NBR1-Ig-like domain-containing protein n=1 Tax=Methanocella sp. MCL-LM TaxID=3412035 RepID=UPI003C7402EE
MMFIILMFISSISIAATAQNLGQSEDNNYNIIPEEYIASIHEEGTSTWRVSKDAAQTGYQYKLSSDLLQLSNNSLLPPGVSIESFRNTMVEQHQLIPSDSKIIVDSTLIPITTDLVYVYVYLTPNSSTHAIDHLVWNVTSRDESFKFAAAWVYVKNLTYLASSENVRYVESVTPPHRNVGSVTTEGDAIMKTNEVRSIYGYTGSGIKVGVISDGVTNIEQSQASGNLPYNVVVLSEGMGDEGTAMLEIIHDMAPGAQLYFHDSGDNVIEFTNAIDALVNQGCTVIVDDMRWINEPFFEDGYVASHVTSVVANRNVIYINSAGNYAENHYQEQYHDDGFYYHNRHIPIVIPPSSSVRIILEWNDKWGESTNDYVLRLYDSNGNLVGYNDNWQGLGYPNPYESIVYTNYYSTSRTYYIYIENYNGKAQSKTLEIYTFGAKIDPSYNTASDSIFSHAAVPGVITVGAIDAYDLGNDDIQMYSSRGPVTISHPSAQTRQKPDICGIDDVRISGAGNFGSYYYGNYYFYGTSAAAPSVAAVVADLWSAYPTKNKDEIKSLLYWSATDIGAAGFDNTYGFGRVDALQAVRSGFQPNAIVVTNDIPATMQIGKTYTVNLTMTNNGNMPWNPADGVRLGAVGEASGDAAKFSSTRIPIQSGMTIAPGQSYTWTFTMTAPGTGGTYTPQYQMVWDGHQWFGQAVSKQISVIAMPDALLKSISMPDTMLAGQAYPVTVTFENTGNIAWTDLNAMRLGAVGDTTGDAVKFTGIRQLLPTGTTVQPGEQYTWSYTMAAPWTPGTYNPQYRMVWDGHYWFGNTAGKTVTVQWPNAAKVSDNIPSTMLAGKTYPISITMTNSGNMPWTANDQFSLGAVGESTGDAAKFTAKRLRMPAGTVIPPGESYTWTMNMVAPTTSGTYNPQYQMVWDGHTWFGQTIGKPVSVIYAPDADLVSMSIPDTMYAGQTYTASVTLTNTGNTAWSEADATRLGAVGEGSGDAAKFSSTRIFIAPGTTVQPGQQRVFTFTMTAPYSGGTYNPQYQMVWDGHQWFGDTVGKSVTVLAPNAQYISDTIPTSMTAYRLYWATVTLRNTGTMPWTDSSAIRLGAVGDGAGDAAKFTSTRLKVPSGTSVAPGETYTFGFIMTAPTSVGTYNPQYQMVWDGHQWFGSTISKTVTVSTAPALDSQIVWIDSPSSMEGYHGYTTKVTMRNTGTTTWNEASSIRLGAIGDGSGDAARFSTTRLFLPAGTNVAPGQQYTFTLAMVAPGTSGSYNPQYRMVRDGVAWFGDTWSNTLTVSAPGALDSQLISNTIPSTMTHGQSYSVSMTLRNTGSTLWNEASSIRLGAIGEGSGVAASFGPTRVFIPAGITVAPGSTYTFTYTMKAPDTAGTYTPQYQMVRDGVAWYGDTMQKTITVV